MSRLVTSAATLVLTLCTGNAIAQSIDENQSAERASTVSPIKHVIIIVGENRSFDHIFATYRPKRSDAQVLNLLSERIVNSDGTPGPHFAKAHQYEIVAPPNHDK